jgi:hypothetical protein
VAVTLLTGEASREETSREEKERGEKEEEAREEEREVEVEVEVGTSALLTFLYGVTSTVTSPLVTRL